MFRNTKPWFLFAIALLLGLISASKGAISAETLEREALEKRIDVLMEKILEYRLDALEKTRSNLITDLNAWMDGDADFDGKKVQLMITEAERVAAEYGVDVAQLRRIHQVARSAVLRADFLVPGKSGSTTLHEFTEDMRDLPVAGDVVAHYGLIDEAEERAAESQRKRVVQYKNLIQVYLKALTTRDPAEALANFENYAKLIQRYVTDQERQVLDADMKAMLATQSAVAEFSSFLPLVGEAIDILALASGETMDGEQLTGIDQTISGILLATPVVIEQSIKRKFRAAMALAGLVESLKSAATDQVVALNKRLAKKVGADRAVQEAQHKLERALPDKIKAKAKVYLAKRAAARRYVDDFGDAAERDAAFRLGRQNASNKIEAFKEAVTQGDSVERRKAMLRIQTDKHAMQRMKVGEVSEDLIKAFNNEIEALYGVTDTLTKQRLADTYMSTFAKAKGLDLDNLDDAAKLNLRSEVLESIDVVLITNPSKEIKVSFDRDVTAKIRINGELRDIPAEVLDDAYGPSLYQAINRRPPKSPKDAKHLMEQLDQVSTDSLHPEAYTDLSVAIYMEGADVKFKDPDQIAHVFAFKGNHWFETAEKKFKIARESGETKQVILAQAEADWEEGFRQLTKQYKSQIVKRRKVMMEAFRENQIALRKGLKDAPKAEQVRIQEALKHYEKGLPSSVKEIPDDLKDAFEIMEQIGKAETPASAMRKLANMGMTPQEIGRRMGQHVERMHRNYPIEKFDPVNKTVTSFGKGRRPGAGDPVDKDAPENSLTKHLHYPEGWLKNKGSTLQ